MLVEIYESISFYGLYWVVISRDNYVYNPY